MPQVDVIIPAYNAARYLAIAIESVIAQTFNDWRILLVDDGSKDNIEEIVAPFAALLGDKLKYIRQANCGMSAARNAAIRHSSSEFLAMLDADDVWLPDRLSESMKSFENRPRVGLSYGFIALIDQKGAVISVFDLRQKHGEGRIAPYIYMRSIHLPCPTVTFRRRCVEEVGVFDETLRSSEDRDLWLRIALRYEVALVPKIIAHYRTSPDSVSTNSERMFKAQLQFTERHYGAPGCGGLQRRIAIGRAYKQRAEALWLRRKSFAAVANSIRALTYYPFDLASLRTSGSLLLRGVGLKR